MMRIPMILAIAMLTFVSCASPRPVERGDLVRVRLRPAVSRVPLEGALIAAGRDSIVVQERRSDLERPLAREDVLEIHVSRPDSRRAMQITGCAMTGVGLILPFLVDPAGVLGWSVWALGQAAFAWGCFFPSDMWRSALPPDVPSDPSSP